MGLGLASACGGAVSLDDGRGASGGSGGLIPGTGGTGGAFRDAGRDARADARDGALDGFNDPGCPDAAPPPPQLECDPFAPLTSCPAGTACYPIVIGSGDPSGCGQEVYGAVCAPAGVAQQGDSCENTNCAAGFLCVKGAQPGLSCVRLCDPTGANTCPAGMICGDVDVEGIGGCH